MKFINIFFIVLFVLSAVLQINDPDPVLWILIYMYGAWLSYMSLKGRFNPTLHKAGILFYAGYALVLLFSQTGVLSWINDHNYESLVQSMKAEKPWIEETREFLGLLLLISALSLNWISYTYRKKAALVAGS